MRQRSNVLKRGLAMLLAFILCVSGLGWMPTAGMTAKAAGRIEISSARELAQIGKSAEYRMDGDYVLTEDIDLSTYNNGEWIPIGGSGGPEYGLVRGDRVFSGTFDGNGKTISNLKISFDGSSSQNTTNQSGLFAMIGSDSSEDYAEVKNLNFTNVSVSHLLGRGDSIGTLAADVDGYARIDNIAVLSGEIRATSGTGSDLIGIGGVVGQVRTNNSAVRMTNLYNAADVEVAQGLGSSWVRCGGILGRIHQSSHIGALSSCLNVGKITYKGGQGYAINGYSSSADSEVNTTNITACFGLAGTGKFTSAVTQITEAELGSESVKNALGADYWTISGNRIIPVISEGKVVTPIPMPTFADGDSVSSVTKPFTLPLAYESERGTEEITWSSSNPEIIAINGADALVRGVTADTQVTLTARTGSGKTKTITVTVVSNLILEIDQEYAKPGTSITAAVANSPEELDIRYRWEIDGKTVSQTNAYTPEQSDVNHFITVTASTGKGEKIDDLKFYCSKLPVVYIDTEDGHGITSKDKYKSASMRIQGNDRFNSQNTTLYNGGISIRGRGNSTWNTSFNKLPYKIKLDSKTNLFGFGKSKHWALLANYMDESLVRNTTSYDLSGTMGMNYLKSTHVDVILNGVYAGNYQLVGNVRVESSRVDIYDWEDCAKEAAKSVIKQAKDTTDGAADLLEDRLVENLGWITSGTVDYNGNPYDITACLPRDEEGNVDYSGGFLMELDGYFDEVSKFKTRNNQPIMLKSPEFAYTNESLFNSVQNYIQAVENSIVSGDFQTEYEQQSCHYSDLVDMDSLVRYFILNEFFWNTETMKKSTYMYKDLGGKLYIGPVWDMDWTSNSLISASETSNYDRWVTSDRNDSNGHCAQNQQWYKYLLSEPYFAVKVYECYRDNRQNFEDIVKVGGIIDQQAEYLKESADTNFRNGFVYHNSADFDGQISRLKTFLRNRLNWLDQQFTSVEKLLSSFDQGLKNSYNSPVTSGFRASGSILVEADTAEKGRTTYTAKVSGSSIKKVGFYINGKLAGTADVTDSTAKLTVEDTCLEKESNRSNTVQVRGLDANGALLSNGSITNYAVFEKEIEEEVEKGHLIINQVYGGGMNDKTPVSHSFVELYNPTDSAVDLDGYSLGYLSGGENGAAATEQKLSLSGTLPAYTSYLVRCEEQDASTPELIKFSVKKFDQEWEQTIDNKRFRIVLYKGAESEDGVSVNEGSIEGAALPDGTISKQKAIRRRNFADTNNNRDDFEVVNYRDEADAAAKKYPRSMSDGVWRTDDEPVVTPDPETWFTVTFNTENGPINVKVPKGGVVTPIPEPVKEGYTFEGWYLEDTRFDFSTLILDDIELNARWRKKEEPAKLQYVVTFNADGVITKVTVEEGGLVTPIADPAKEGYQFDGWYSNGRKYDFSAKVSGDLVLTAQWIKKPTDEPKLAAPKVTEVKSVISSKASRVRVKVGKVSGAASYQIYRKKGSATKLMGETKTGIFYDDTPVSGKVSYLARAASGKTVSGFGASRSITLPKTTAKIAVKALKGKKRVSLKWKRVKGATGYVIYRSTKKNSGYKRIAMIKKGTKPAYTDRKGLKKGKKYYYRIVTAKKKIYSPAKTSKVVKV